MSRWKIIPADITEREKDYTAGFDAHNVDTGAVIHIEMTQTKPGPASDLVGALRAIAQTLLIAASGDEPDPRKLN